MEALGLQTSYTQLRVAELGDDVWQGVRNKYWHFPVYFLPLVQHAPDHAPVHAHHAHQGAHEAAQVHVHGDGKAEADVTAAS